MLYYCLQLCMFLFAIFSAWEEENFTFPFREFHWPGNYFHAKSPRNKAAHLNGYLGVGAVVIAFGCAGAAGMDGWKSVWLFLIFAFTTGGIYWQTFDSAYGMSIRKGLFYLGEPGTDQLIIRLLGKRAGLWKFLILITAVIILNILYLAVK